MWLAVFLSFAGLILVAKVWNGFKFDLIGLTASLLCAFALAAYFLMSEKIGKTREPIATLIFGMGFASIFWLIVLPPWSFPFEVFTTNIFGVSAPPDISFVTYLYSLADANAGSIPRVTAPSFTTSSLIEIS